MIRTTARRARQHHRCEGYCHRPITPGEVYIEHVVLPNHDVLPAWWRFAECCHCATAANRGHLIDDREARP